MKKTLLVFFSISTLLASCGGSTQKTFFGQTLKLKGYTTNLNDKNPEYSNKTAKELLIENMNNIDWDNTEHKFADHSSADAVINDMNNYASTNFTSAFANWSFAFSSKEEGKCTVTRDGQTNKYDAVLYQGQEELMQVQNGGDNLYEFALEKFEGGKVVESSMKYYTAISVVEARYTFRFPFINQGTYKYSDIAIVYDANFAAI